MRSSPMPRSCAWPPRRARWCPRACAGGTASAPMSATAPPATRPAPPLPWRPRCSTSPPTAGNRAWVWRPRTAIEAAVRACLSMTTRPRRCVVSARAASHWCASWVRRERGRHVRWPRRRAAWASTGVPVRGLAPSATAASVLSTETGVSADTVAKFLWENARSRSGPAMAARRRRGRDRRRGRPTRDP